MFTKFKKLFFAPPTAQELISKEIDFHIKNANWDILLGAVEAGYSLSRKQVIKCIECVGKNTKSFESEDMMPIEKYLIDNHPSTIHSYSEMFFENRHPSTTSFVHFFWNEHFRNLISEENFKKSMTIVSKYPTHLPSLYSELNLEEKLREHYRKKFQDSKNNLIKKINPTYIKPVKILLQDLPPGIQLQVKMINQMVDQIDISKLTDGSKADLKTLLEVTLPKLVTQYAAIDESTLQYKNEKNQTVGDMMNSGLKHVRNSLKEFVEEIEQQKIKELKITARQLSAAK